MAFTPNFPAGTFQFVVADNCHAGLLSSITDTALSFVIVNDAADATKIVANFPDAGDDIVLEVLTIENEKILCYQVGTASGSPSQRTVTVYDEDTHLFGILSAGQNGRGFDGTVAVSHNADVDVDLFIESSAIDEIQAAIAALEVDKAFEDETVLTDGSNPATFIEFTEQGAAPGTPTDAGRFYTKEITGVTEAFYIDTAGQEVQLTNNGAVAGGGVDTSANFNWTGEHDFQSVFKLNSVTLLATATEINQALDGISANVTFTNLNTLTAGVTSEAGDYHYHLETKVTQVRTSAAGSGTMVIPHGLGRIPNEIEIYAFSASAGFSWSRGWRRQGGNPDFEDCIAWRDATTKLIDLNVDEIIRVDDGANRWFAAFSANPDATNISLTVTKGNNPGDLTIMMKCK